ncbi:tRNA-U20a,U20b-dihydrouridine synthase [Iodobacter fluviatilis]|uniref:tRNA-dihydrouridine(16) synthase n=1 Tax=Iodobacter fluviatilis TaxID=537 RepID=A0A377QA72_9NEIS|nr:tRNA-U20a,U20b-dihydrouridine synthase [Iodobacter fluviatilis]STQ91630.1 Probable tRNA-dihydrouridine synthase [Iodobacter fluviatilis]
MRLIFCVCPDFYRTPGRGLFYNKRLSALLWLYILKILLAPMEGLLDFVLRDVLTRVGGIDMCVTEFIRVSGSLLPNKTFLRIAPELLNGSKTVAGVPVSVQLLGSDPVCMAENAARLAELGPYEIDLNFGCPAKSVNRHRGGAVLLQEPELIYEIVGAVRRAVPAHIPVTAKMRLGYNDHSQTIECAQAMASAGAARVVVHARTKLDGYKPPAYWELIPAVREALAVPVVANGEIWTVEEFHRCAAVSGCDQIMLGRGIVSNPGLALMAKNDQPQLPWADLQPLFICFWQLIQAQHIMPKHRAGRMKQWLTYLRRTYPEAEALFAQVRTLTEPDDVAAVLLGK